jgi:hypothetical protein
MKMKEASCLKRMSTVPLQVLAVIVLAIALSACERNNSHPIPVSEFSTKIAGLWQGTVGDSSETMSLNGDGTFVCQVQQTGFIANMLYPVGPGTVSGTWSVNGNIVSLVITGAKHEHLANRATSSVIVSLNKNDLVLKSAGGEASTFVRIRSP